MADLTLHTETGAEVVLPDIVEAVKAERMKGASTYPVRSLYASKIGHPCERFLCYSQIAWDLKPPPDVYLMGIFKRGKVTGDALAMEVKAALKDRGIDVVQQEVSIPNNSEGIGGRMDFGLMLPLGPGKRPIFVPVEAKSMNPYFFKALPDGGLEPEAGKEALDWFLNHPSGYIQAYPAQILTYMHYRRCPWGYLYVRDALNWADKQVLIYMDEERCAALMAKAHRVGAVVENGTKLRVQGGDWEAVLPDRVQYHPDVCGKCDFKHVCIPDILAAPGIVNKLSDEALNEACRIYDEMAEPARARDGANEDIKGHLKAIMAGVAKEQTRTIITKDYGIHAKQGAKSITKKVLPLGELAGKEEVS